MLTGDHPISAQTEPIIDWETNVYTKQFQRMVDKVIYYALASGGWGGGVVREAL